MLGISVIIPTHNRGDLLPRAIRSVLGQSFEAFELIVVDDASTDETQEVVATAFDDPRLRYVRREESGSAGAARNTGMEAARGDIICFLDDDDEYLPGYLEKVHETFEEQPAGVGLVWTGVQKVYSGDETEMVQKKAWTPSFSSREEAYLSFLRSRYIGTNCGIAVRRKVIEVVGGFDERLKKAEDTEWFPRVVRRFDFHVIPDTLVRVYMHGGPRLTAYDLDMAHAYTIILEKNQSMLEKHPEVNAALLYKTGWIYYRAGDRSRGRHYISESLKRRPLNLKALVTMCLYEVSPKLGGKIHDALSQFKRYLSA